MARFTPHLSYANVTASLALFLALGGISWAAATLPKNSVGTKQLKRNAVTSAKVRNGSLLRADFKAGQLPAGAQGVPGPKGDPGPRGETGAKGDTGPAGPVTGDLPSGATLVGAFNVDFVAQANNEFQGADISFGLRLPSKPAIVVRPEGAQPTDACPGTLTDPQAAAGTLCIYENTHSNAHALLACDAACTANIAERYGAELYIRAAGSGRAFIDGSWAVTAP